MQGQCTVLVAAGALEERRTLLQILDALSINSFGSSGLQEALEVLSQRPIDLVFCDERLQDGSYRDLLRAARTNPNRPRVVVTIRTRERDDYLEARRLGAYDAIRFPVVATDVELLLLQAMHESGEKRADRLTV